MVGIEEGEDHRHRGRTGTAREGMVEVAEGDTGEAIGDEEAEAEAEADLELLRRLASGGGVSGPLPNPPSTKELVLIES